MKTAIVIPAHNEEAYIGRCLDSFASQTRKPDLLLVVNDNSTDHTSKVVEGFSAEHTWINLVHHNSDTTHAPGAKVVNAFNYGLSQLENSYEFIGKFDADIVLPTNYLEEVMVEFEKNPKLGLCSGLLYIRKKDAWIYENISDRSHIRGPVKLYRQSCLEKIGGLRPSVGWDTVDELLAQYRGFEIQTLKELHVKHLRPTASAYNGKSARLRGEALYKMRYGRILSLLAMAKMAWHKRSVGYFFQGMKGYGQARKQGMSPIVNEEEGVYIRKYRWKNIRKKLF